MTCLSGPHSTCHLRGVTEKFNSPPYSEWMAASKMAAAMRGSHLQLKDQL